MHLKCLELAGVFSRQIWMVQYFKTGGKLAGFSGSHFPPTLIHIERKQGSLWRETNSELVIGFIICNLEKERGREIK